MLKKFYTFNLINANPRKTTFFFFTIIRVHLKTNLSFITTTKYIMFGQTRKFNSETGKKILSGYRTHDLLVIKNRALSIVLVQNE